MRGAALAGSNMENFELDHAGRARRRRRAQRAGGEFAAAVVVGGRVSRHGDAAACSACEDDGTRRSRSCPPTSCRCCSAIARPFRIAIAGPSRSTLRQAAQAGRRRCSWPGNAAHRRRRHDRRPGRQARCRAATLAHDRASFAPPSPDAPEIDDAGAQWQVALPAQTRLYVERTCACADAMRSRRRPSLPKQAAEQCLSLTRVDRATASNRCHRPTRCVGAEHEIAGHWPRRWTAPQDGPLRACALDYRQSPTAPSTPASPPA